jgi:hypothetical protein
MWRYHNDKRRQHEGATEPGRCGNIKALSKKDPWGWIALLALWALPTIQAKPGRASCCQHTEHNLTDRSRPARLIIEPFGIVSIGACNDVSGSRPLRQEAILINNTSIAWMGS